MSGTLFVVATPIGNLEDITLRALRVLREAQCIAAEDTRRTAHLLARHAIQTPTLSFHEHNSRSRLPQLLARLRAGDRVALVSDAGTPGLSDPGVELVRACVAEGIGVDPIPGPSAVLTAAVASGFPMAPLAFLGFRPIRGKDRTLWDQQLACFPGTVAFFESPHRIRATMAAISGLLGERQIVVGRELTKVHQEFLRGTADPLLAALGEPRGEYTVVVEPPRATDDERQAPITDDEIAHLFRQSTETAGLGRRAAVAAVAKSLGMPSRDVYAAVERSKSSVE